MKERLKELSMMTSYIEERNYSPATAAAGVISLETMSPSKVGLDMRYADAKNCLSTVLRMQKRKKIESASSVRRSLDPKIVK